MKIILINELSNDTLNSEINKALDSSIKSIIIFVTGNKKNKLNLVRNDLIATTQHVSKNLVEDTLNTQNRVKNGINTMLKQDNKNVFLLSVDNFEVANKLVELLAK